MAPDHIRGYRLRQAFIRTPLRQILDPPQWVVIIHNTASLTITLKSGEKKTEGQQGAHYNNYYIHMEKW